MLVEQTFSVSRPPETVFDYLHPRAHRPGPYPIDGTRQFAGYHRNLRRQNRS
jgi:hypothetical protein